MKNNLKIKNLAFTLAEMMVILGIFSAIAAATLPVISLRQNLDNSESATNPSAVDAWVENTDYNALSYYNAGSSLVNSSAVMVGGQVSADAASIGYPQLIVKKNKSANYNGGSEIVLFKKNGNQSYYGGRILVGSDGEVANSIALGANALDNMQSNHVSYGRDKVIAIGTYALNNQSSAGGGVINSIAVGYKTLNPFYGKSHDVENTVAIGIESGSGASYEDSVLAGHYAGVAAVDNGEYKKSVLIGNYAGANSSENIEDVAIGTRAGSGLSTSKNNVAIGYYAAYSTGVSVTNSVAVGSYAAYSVSSVNDLVAIGADAANSAHASDNDIYIGRDAGMNNRTGGNGDRHAVMLGAFAGSRLSSLGNPSNAADIGFGRTTPILIGAYAGYNVYSMTSTGSGISNTDPVVIGFGALSHFPTSITVNGVTSYVMDNVKVAWTNFPDVTIGTYAGQGAYGDLNGSVLIGTYAGANTNSLVHTVCMGHGTCANSRGSYDVRIAPNGMNRNEKADLSEFENLRAGLSHIGYLGGIYDKSLPSTPYKTGVYNNLFNPDVVGTGDDSTMVITPKMSKDDYDATSSIILYADKVFGPTKKFTEFSDRRLKENIKPARYGLNEIRKLNVYEYTWKSDKSNTPKIGVIAQEMQEVLPEGVHKGQDGYLSIDSMWIIYPMVRAIQELDKTVIVLQHNLKSYAKEYINLSKRVVVLQQKVKELEKENKALAKDIKVAYKKAKNAERR